MRLHTSVLVPGGPLAVFFLYLMTGSSFGALNIGGDGHTEARIDYYNNVDGLFHTETTAENFSGEGSAGSFLAGGASYGNVQTNSSSSISLTNLMIQGQSNSGAAAVGFGRLVSLFGASSEVSQLVISSPTPFLFKASGTASAGVGGDENGRGSSGANLQVTEPSHVYSVIVEAVLNGSGPVSKSVSLSAVGLSQSSLALTGDASSGSVLNDDGTRSANASFSASVEIDENVVKPPIDVNVQARFGHGSAVVTYPVPTTYTGLSQDQFTNVSTILYTPASGSQLAAGTHTVTRVVSYSWGVDQSEMFTVHVEPLITQPEIVRVSWSGQPIPVYFPVANIGFSNVSFYIPNGALFSFGQTSNIADADLNGEHFQQTFNVIVINGTGGVASVRALFPNDSDGDGQSDWLEIIAGTNPNNPEDRFQVAQLRRSGNDIDVSWYGAEGITYQLEAEGLNGQTPQTVGSPISPIGTRQLLTVKDLNAALNSSSKFYRISVVTP